jgi:hypothetical protein
VTTTLAPALNLNKTYWIARGTDGGTKPGYDEFDDGVGFTDGFILNVTNP